MPTLKGSGKKKEQVVILNKNDINVVPNGGDIRVYGMGGGTHLQNA
ncbi:hypothetical protein V7266_00105 [Neobacillus drentensis]